MKKKRKNTKNPKICLLTKSRLSPINAGCSLYCSAADSRQFPLSNFANFHLLVFIPFLERTEIKFTLLYLKYISKFHQLICQFWLQWLFFCQNLCLKSNKVLLNKEQFCFQYSCPIYITSLIHNIFVPLLRLTPLADFKIIGCGVWTNCRIPCENPQEVQSNAEKYSPPATKVLLANIWTTLPVENSWKCIFFSQGAITDHDQCEEIYPPRSFQGRANIFWLRNSLERLSRLFWDLPGIKVGALRGSRQGSHW